VERRRERERERRSTGRHGKKEMQSRAEREELHVEVRRNASNAMQCNLLDT
jgi:hypothetical protein